LKVDVYYCIFVLSFFMKNYSSEASQSYENFTNLPEEVL